jgi:hypothetical protein
MIFLTAACQNLAELSLKPPVTGKVYSITVSDATEIDLLRQQIHLDIIAVRDSLVYFHSESDEILGQLTSMGYGTPKTQAPEDVYMLYGEVTGKYNEEEIVRKGVKVINREKDHLIVYGSISKLKDLGYKIYVPEYELRPREIEVLVPGQSDIQKLVNLGVDVFSAAKDSTGKGGYKVHGTAFDHQIDSINKMHFPVTIIRQKI